MSVPNNHRLIGKNTNSTQYLLMESMKHRHFRVKIMSVLDMYRTPILARHLPIHIRHTKAMSNVKNQKTCMSESCPYSKSHTNHYWDHVQFQEVIEIMCLTL